MKEMSGAKNTKATRGADWDTESCTNLMTALFPLAKMATVSYTTREKKPKTIGTAARMSATAKNCLLVLAEEIDANGDALLADTSLLVGSVGLMRCYAESIRKTLGVE